ncbi:uncharacterized protein LOC124124941 isoform X1 [Haliotis rufescens]|uniref:uncharacterized protein LOC124124941 isoform X1 n=1 Tax=Haliotis rufescens TaxID=6454 RepID=UPI00201E7897|nr:uncharacterized protein LOC124124941 isoform X1 [Haliotis rufescens]
MLLEMFKIFLCNSIKDILNSNSSNSININVPGVYCVGTNCKKMLVCQSSDYRHVDQICTATMKKVSCDEVRRPVTYKSVSHSNRHCPGHFECLSGASWDIVNVKCVPHVSFYGKPSSNVSTGTQLINDLGFNLKPGMTVTWGLAGGIPHRPQTKSQIFLQCPDLYPRVYMASFRVWLRKPKVIFNTLIHGSGYGRQESSSGWRPNDYDHFIIDVHVGIGVFETYLDGSLLMVNNMRVPFTEVRYAGVNGITAWHKLQVGFNKC